MNKKDDLTLVPKYRFPEFKDGEGWEVKELGESLDYLQPTPYLVQTENYDNKYTIPVLTAGKSFILGYTNEQEGIFNNKLPVIIFDDFTTDSKFVDFPFKVKSSAIKILLAKYNFNIKFIFEIMQMVSYEVSVHKRHWISIFSKLKVLIPQSKEQQKIADCLSSIDDLISAEEKKLSLLNDYKKGWMQKLFPTEGKTVPEWRFPEFKDDNNWKCVEIDTVGKVITGKTPPTSNDSLWNGSIQFVTPTDIVEDKYQRLVQRTVVKTSNMKVLPKGTIMFTCIASIGKMAISVYPSVTNQQINSIITKNGYYNEFIYYSLFRNVNKIKSDLSNTTVPIINKTDFSKIQISVTLNEKEQEKIANFLSGIDKLISSQKEKIEKLKQHKKALMQGLFPAAEEVWK